MGVGRGRVSVVGEVKWRQQAMDVSVLGDLEQFKLPALQQAGFKTAPGMVLLLVSKGGYTEGLRRAAATDPRIHLVDVGSELQSVT